MKKIVLVGLITLISLIVILFPNVALADADKASEIDMKITPNDYLFHIDNMKPGDWAPRTIVIANNGKSEFEYSMAIRNDGDKKLFNGLLMEISDAHTEIFKGKLADFKELPIRILSPSAEDKLEVTITFPEHLGNDYQGLDAEFSFVFIAEGKDHNQITNEVIAGAVGSSGNGGSGLPNTATNIFMFLLVGTVLITGGGIVYFYRRLAVSQT